jgi:hypothetical protein
MLILKGLLFVLGGADAALVGWTLGYWEGSSSGRDRSGGGQLEWMDRSFWRTWRRRSLYCFLYLALENHLQKPPLAKAVQAGDNRPVDVGNLIPGIRFHKG